RRSLFIMRTPLFPRRVAAAAGIVLLSLSSGLACAQPAAASVQALSIPCGNTTCDAEIRRPPGVARPPVIVMAHGFGALRDWGLTPFAVSFSEGGCTKSQESAALLLRGAFCAEQRQAAPLNRRRRKRRLGVSLVVGVIAVALPWRALAGNRQSSHDVLSRLGREAMMKLSAIAALPQNR
ncbi:MAG: hypothetical protein ACK4Z7_14680, partial [Novosphingobium sp.]